MVNALAYWKPNDVAESYFRPPDKRVQLNFKVRSSLKEQLQGVVRLWKLRAEIEGKDPDDVDMTYVAERLLTLGVDGAWGEVAKVIGISSMPATEAEWADLEKSLRRDAKSSSGASKK